MRHTLHEALDLLVVVNDRPRALIFPDLGRQNFTRLVTLFVYEELVWIQPIVIPNVMFPCRFDGDVTVLVMIFKSDKIVWILIVAEVANARTVGNE
jgi:hypothetical protein